MTPTNFRCLIVLSALLPVASGLVDALLPSLLPLSLSEAYESLPYPAMFKNTLWFVLFGPWLALVLVSTVGLFFFKRWARLLSFYTTVIGFVFYPFFGPILASGWSSALSDASFITWGAVLAIAYYSPLGERFTAKSGR
ncbi:MAG: hypothetical protein ACXW1P_06865 [Methylophilaceae bacterium]